MLYNIECVMVKRTGASFVFDLDVTSLRSADENEAIGQLELFLR